MFDALSTEVVLSLATVSVSGLALCGTLVALKATERKRHRIDIDAVVNAAPYKRLHNVVKPRSV